MSLGLLSDRFKHVGFNKKISKHKSDSVSDEAARRHDKGYDKLIKKNRRPYTHFNKYDQEFLDELEAGQYKDLADYAIGTLASGIFKTKKALLPHDMPKSLKQIIGSKKRTHQESEDPDHEPYYTEEANMQHVEDVEMETTKTSAPLATSSASGSPTIATGEAANTGAGGAAAVEGMGANGGLETIPGHQPDSFSKPVTLKTSQTYRVFYDNATNTADPVEQPNPNGVDGDPYYAQSTVINDSNRLTEVTSDWHYIPNNNLDLYLTHAQISRFFNAGYTAYRVKKLGVKIYGMFNMQYYNISTNTLQGSATGYGVIIEPDNDYPFQNQTQAPYLFNRLVNPNPSQTFPVGDPWELSTALNVAPEDPISNRLQPAKYLVPGQLLGESNADQWFSDMTRHAKQSLIRNGDHYEWSWDNPDDSWINYYNPNRAFYNQDYSSHVREFGFLPIQALNNRYVKSGRGLWQENTYVYGQEQNIKWSNQNMAYCPIQRPDKVIPPILFKIPKLINDIKDLPKINHSCWMYLDYSCEIEFFPPRPNKIYRGLDLVSNFDGYGGYKTTFTTQPAFNEIRGQEQGVTFTASNITERERQFSSEVTAVQKRQPPESMSQVDSGAYRNAEPVV